MDYKKLAIATTLGLGLVAPLATPFSEVGLVAKANEEVTFYPVPRTDLEDKSGNGTFIMNDANFEEKFYYQYANVHSTGEKIFDLIMVAPARFPLSSNIPVGYIFVTDKEITKEIAEANLDKATKLSAKFEGGHYVPNSSKAEFPALSKVTLGADNKKDDKATNKETDKEVTPTLTNKKDDKTTSNATDKGVTPTLTNKKDDKTTSNSTDKGVTPTLSNKKDDKATNKETDKGVTPTLSNKKDDKKLESTTDKKDNKTPLTSDSKITSVTNKETKVLPKTSAVSEKAKNNNSYLLSLGLATLGLLILSKKIKN